MPNNLYQRTGIWYARFNLNGREIRQSLRTRDQSIAQDMLPAVMGEHYGDDISTYSPRDLVGTLFYLSTKRDGWVYFVQGKPSGPIKIGWARVPRKRLKELQVGSPVLLRILVALPAIPGAESALHTKFARDRLHGEWFQPSKRLRRLITLAQERMSVQP